MRVAMIGTGYVGLVSGACFSQFGVNVVCVDKAEEKIRSLQDGRMPIYEPGLEAMVADNVAAGRLSFTTDLGAAVDGTDAVFIAVGTPSRRGDGHADLSYVHAAAEEIAEALTGYAVVVTKSTVPVGTGREVERIIAQTRPDADYDVVSNPEFLREGSAINDFMRPDRVVIGTDSDRAREVMRQLYRPLFLIETPILFTARESAELIKYASNTFLATKITFINEIADLCERVGADVHAVAKGVGLDGRIGKKFLHPGPGYGGSCFPKDTLALVRTAQEAGTPLRIIETVVAVNDGRKRRMADKVIAACDGSVAGKSIAVLGLTFKPNTDDMRESPSLDIIPALQARGARIRAYDPEGMEEAKPLLADVEWCDDAYSTMEGADALAIVTEWNEFRALDLERARSLMTRPIMVDYRNIYDPEEATDAGFSYHCVGRSTDAEPVDAETSEAPAFEVAGQPPAMTDATSETATVPMPSSVPTSALSIPPETPAPTESTELPVPTDPTVPTELTAPDGVTAGGISDAMSSRSGHTFHPTILREYDIRGIVGDTLTEDDAVALGRAYGARIVGDGGRRVCTGYDGRLSSPQMEAALTDGLTASGLDVVRIGLGPSPMLYFAVHHLDADGGIMVTGSHNPPEYNGFKLMAGKAAMHGRQIAALGDIARAGDFTDGRGQASEQNIQGAYVDRLVADYAGTRMMTIAWDPANGAACNVVGDLGARLIGRHIVLNETVDGTFPGHHPDPTVPENLVELQETVLKDGCNLGLAFDGDGDRIGVVDDRGRILWGDQLLAIFAADVLRQRPGATVIADVKASQVLFDEVARLGGDPLMWRTGHSLIKDKMAEVGAPLAGEMSGHIFFADRYYGFDDGLYAAVRLISILDASGESLADIRDRLPAVYNTPELRFPCAEDRKFAVPNEIKARLPVGGDAALEINDIDGLRVSNGDGWWLLRASNTQDVLVARCEARTEEALSRLKQELTRQLELSGITPPAAL